jgi:hypothetical protein
MFKRTIAGLALAAATIGSAFAADAVIERQQVYVVPATTETVVLYVLEVKPREPYELVDRYNP